MTSGAGRPGQPGQRSIFGTGRGPVFAQMPAYKPVTRGPEAQPQHLPEPPQPDYGTYARQGAEPQSPQMPGVSGYANQNGAAPSYQTPSAPPRNYTTPDFPNPFPPQTYPREPQPQSYQPQPQARPQAHPSQTYPGQSYQPQAPVQPSRQAPMPPSAQPAPAYQPEPNRSFQESGFPDRIFPGQAHPQSDFAEQGFADPNYPDANFADASFPDASFPDASYQDASFPEDKAETDFGASPHEGFSEHEPMHLNDGDASYGNESGSDSFSDSAGHDYAPHAGSGGPRPLPSHHALQAFDAIYDQPPQIPLGRTPQYAQESAPQAFYDGEQADADFLDESQFMNPGEAEAKPARKFSLRSRSIYMVGSALLGAIALGGALAFAYKQSGGAMGGGEPPVVQADSRPVKEAPQQPGGKEFPHKNKLIYERLQNGDQPEAERIVPRQEELAMPAMPGRRSRRRTNAAAGRGDGRRSERRRRRSAAREDPRRPPRRFGHAAAGSPGRAAASRSGRGRSCAGATTTDGRCRARHAGDAHATGRPSRPRLRLLKPLRLPPLPRRPPPTQRRSPPFRQSRKWPPPTRHQFRQSRANMWFRWDRSRIRPRRSPPSPTCSRNIRRFSPLTGPWCRRPTLAPRASGIACASDRSSTNRPQPSCAVSSRAKATPIAW